VLHNLSLSPSHPASQLAQDLASLSKTRRTNSTHDYGRRRRDAGAWSASRMVELARQEVGRARTRSRKHGCDTPSVLVNRRGVEYWHHCHIGAALMWL
jgi:hypothetical protein